MDLKTKTPTSMSIRKLITEKCKQFGLHSTIHGAYYICNNSHWWVSLVWCVIMAASMTLCGFLSHMIWGKFIGDPTFTVVESTRYPTEKIPFPAVTICDTEVVYPPITANITQILRLRTYNETQIDEFYKSFAGVQKKDYKPEAYVKKMHVVLEDLGFTYDILLKQFKKPCDVILHQCAWRSKVNDCADMFRQVFTLFGYCCQFDLSHFRKRSVNDPSGETCLLMTSVVPISRLGRHAKNDTIFVSGAEITEGLEITVDSNRYGNVSSSDGYLLLYVFDEHDELTLLDSSISITPATYFDVTLEMWAIDSSYDVKALSVGNRKCFLTEDDGVNTNSYQDCITKLILRKVVEICRCLPFKCKSADLGLEAFPSCSWYQLSCVYQTIEVVQGDIHNLTPQGACYQKCDFVQYATEAEYLKEARVLGIESKGYSRLTVHFSDDTCMKYRREVLYTWDQMLANLGGIFGLCLGGSIISIIEILWFVLDLFCAVAAVGHKKMSNRARLAKPNGKTIKKKNFAFKIAPQNAPTRRFPFIN